MKYKVIVRQLQKVNESLPVNLYRNPKLLGEFWDIPEKKFKKITIT